VLFVLFYSHYPSPFSLSSSSPLRLISLSDLAIDPSEVVEDIHEPTEQETDTKVEPEVETKTVKDEL